MNRQAPIFSLEYLPLLIRFEMETSRLPAFLGSTLHGVTGWALTRHSESYTYVFENRRLDGAAQDIVNPYIIELPRPEPVYYKGDPLCFKLILIGDAVRYDKDIVTSLTQAHCLGIGTERKAFEQTGIFHGDQNGLTWKQGQFDMNAAELENISVHALQEHASWCSVHLVTPVRIRRGGALVKFIDFPTINRIITRRIPLLT
ncbi:hypothetical protein [Paenibacillus sp. CF095]|uniref:hypothetical protein n=1 Tax=Paenibacillus sp. CF095 TaxID=1881033 RepID=UPI000B810CB2|nr:hypothetical protein [Paenibacillus sp. CF095]